MNLSELICAYRDEADDLAEPYFCSDERLTRFANEAQTEAARRAFLLADSSSALCSVSYAAEAAFITLDPLILSVRSARIGTEPVALVTAEDMACYWPTWQSDTLRAQPQRLVRGLDTGKLQLYPRPATGGTLSLSVYRLPLKPMVAETSKPELREEWHRGLVNWMLYRAYSRHDADAHAPNLAAEALARFEAEFGRGPGARNEEWSRSAAVSLPGPLA